MKKIKYFLSFDNENGLVEKLQSGEMCFKIRNNFDLWKQRIEHVNSGLAEIQVREIKGNRVGKSTEFETIDSNDFISVRRIDIDRKHKNVSFYHDTEGKKRFKIPISIVSLREMNGLESFDLSPGQRIHNGALIMFEKLKKQ